MDKGLYTNLQIYGRLKCNTIVIYVDCNFFSEVGHILLSPVSISQLRNGGLCILANKDSTAAIVDLLRHNLSANTEHTSSWYSAPIFIETTFVHNARKKSPKGHHLFETLAMIALFLCPSRITYGNVTVK